jgi:cytidylate kinase
MSVVAFSETAGSLGAEVARETAATLGYDFADREIITKAAERFHEDESRLAHFTEERPTLRERLSEAQQRYRAYIDAVLLDFAARDNVVILGRAATIVLSRVPYALRVRLDAPETTRARRLEQQLGLTPEAAFDHAREVDRDRAARLKFLYGIAWGEPLLYDLVLNTERVTAGTAVRLIREALADEQFRATPATRQAVADLSLCAQAKAGLVADQATRALHVVVDCRAGTITLSGAVSDEAARRSAEEVVARLPGVAEVVNELVVVSPSRGHLTGV